MSDLKNQGNEFLSLKIVQSGEIKKIPLTPENVKKKFKNIYLPILKELKLKHKDVYLSNEEGKMVGPFDFSLKLSEIINRFGNELKLYSERVS